jgi:hypothetical protein
MADNKQPKSSTKKMPKPKLGPVTKAEKVLSKVSLNFTKIVS